MERTSSTAPAATASKSACWDSLRTWSSSPAPAAREISTIMAVPMAPGMLLTSQVTVVVVLTAGGGLLASWPTMAVSTYCKRVESTCSTMVGMDKNTSVRNSAAVAGGNRAERLVIRGQLPCNGFSAVLRGSQLQVYGSAGQKANTCLPWQGIANCYGRQKALPGGRARMCFSKQKRSKQPEMPRACFCFAPGGSSAPGQPAAQPKHFEAARTAWACRAQTPRCADSVCGRRQTAGRRRFPGCRSARGGWPSGRSRTPLLLPQNAAVGGPGPRAHRLNTRQAASP